jgi:drug/metabolite transporter (DMT)-like permease
MTRAAPLMAQVAAVFIWATTFVVSADALATTSPAVLTVLRFALAAGLLVPLALRRGGLGAVLRAPVAGVLGLAGVAAYYGLQNLGLLSTAPGTAALLQAVLPVAATALAVAFLRERPTLGSLAGLVLATFGVVLVASTSARLDSGVAFILAGVLGYAVYTVLLRRLGSTRSDDGGAPARVNERTDPVVLAAATAVWGLVFLLPWQLWEIMTAQAVLPSTPAAVAETLYLGVIASGATLFLWTYGAARTPASVSGVLTAAVPALGYALAIATGEQPTFTKTAGGVLAVAGVLLTAYASTRPTRSSSAVPAPRSRPRDGIHEPLL